MSLENNNLLCKNMINHIFSYLHSNDIKLVNKKYYDMYKRKLLSSVSSIGKFYIGRKLHGDSPYNYTTLKTLKRFYVTKYTPDMLRDFPPSYLGLLIHLGHVSPTDPNVLKYTEPSPERHRGFVKNFLEFCEEYNVDNNEFTGWGW